MAGLWAPTRPTRRRLGIEGQIVTTNDGGATWSKQVVPWLPFAVAFADSQHGWVAGAKRGLDAAFETVILSTSDGGTSWAEQDVSTIGQQHLEQVCFMDDTRGYAVGWPGAFVLATNTGGIAPPATAASGVDDGAWYNSPKAVMLTATATVNPVTPRSLPRSTAAHHRQQSARSR